MFEKKDAKPWLTWWVLFLKEFDIEIYDKKGDKKLGSKLLVMVKQAEKAYEVEIWRSISKWIDNAGGANTMVYKHCKLFS